MSHKASAWAATQRGISPPLKVLLWQLADHHTPERGCFPSQETLAAACEISRASVNRYLDKLEVSGLVRREKRFDPETKRQLPTRYILAFEPEFETGESRVSDCDTVRVSESEGAVSQNPGEPCVTPGCDNNLVGTQKNESLSGGREAPVEDPTAILEDVLSSDVVEQLAQHLAGKGKPLTIAAARELHQTLEKLGDEADAAALLMIARDWVWLDEEWLPKGMRPARAGCTSSRTSSSRSVDRTKPDARGRRWLDATDPIYCEIEANSPTKSLPGGGGGWWFEPTVIAAAEARLLLDARAPLKRSPESHHDSGKAQT